MKIEYRKAGSISLYRVIGSPVWLYSKKQALEHYLAFGRPA